MACNSIGFFAEGVRISNVYLEEAAAEEVVEEEEKEEEEEEEKEVEDVICTRETIKSQTSLGFVEFALGKDHNFPF